MKTKGDAICCVVTQHSSWILNSLAAVPPLLKVQPCVWAVPPEQLLELQSLFSLSATMGVIQLPNPSRILGFSFHIILILLQQTTAERELKFVVVVSRFVFSFVLGNTGNFIWLLNQTSCAVALRLFRHRDNYHCPFAY